MVSLFVNFWTVTVFEMGEKRTTKLVHRLNMASTSQLSINQPQRHVV